MSDPPTSPTMPVGGACARLPEWARPRDSERRGQGSLRLAETTVLILVGVFLAVATANDVVRQTHVNHRLVADLRTWREATGHDYHNVNTEQDVKGHTTRDVVCGNISPGGPDERAQLCLALVGPTIEGKRSVSGGYYLVAKAIDERRNRYACFGAPAGARSCGLSPPPTGSPPAPPVRIGRP